MDPRLKDWRWRLNHLYKIVNKDGDLITFKENDIQKKVNNSRRKRKMILKARQFGITTNEILKQLDFVAFGMNKTACIVADEQSNLEKIFSKVRLAYEHMPSQFKPVLDRGGGSKYELRFPKTNSKIFCTIEARGVTVHWLHVSEDAFAKHERVKATLEAVPKNGIVTFESTPNGMGGHFYRRWVTKSDRLEKIFLPWFFDKTYKLNGDGIVLTDDEIDLVEKVNLSYGITLTKDQIAFRRAKQGDLEDMFIQEYPEDPSSCFLASGNAAMDLDRVNKLLLDSIDPIKDTGTMKIWKEYDSSKHYVCGADTAEGRGGDYSVATIFEAESRQEVAQIRSNRWRPREFALKINELCSMYRKHGKRWPLLGVERNNHGHAVLLELDEHIKYPNLYQFKDGECGWKTDSITRPLMIDTFIDGVENGTCRLNSRETLGECLTLIDNNGKIEAEDGENDDCIIASAIGIQMIIELAPTLFTEARMTDLIKV